VSTHVAQPEQLRVLIDQVIEETGKYVIATEYKLLAYRSTGHHTSDKLKLSVVSHVDKLVEITGEDIKSNQNPGHTDGSRSGVKMFLRVVILVFAATCCTAMVIGKSLHTRH
jgi:hypothetical protein